MREDEGFDSIYSDQRNRDAKALARAAKHRSELESAEVRALSQRAVARRDKEEDEQAGSTASGNLTGLTPPVGAPNLSLSSLHGALEDVEPKAAGPNGVGGPAAAQGGPPSLDLMLRDELAEVRRGVPPGSLRSCTPESVQVLLTASRVRSVLLKAFFPAGYPTTPLALELQPGAGGGGRGGGGGGGSGLSSELLVKLHSALEAEVRKHVGGPQVLHAIRWLQDYLTHNRLAAAYNEVRQLRAMAAAMSASGSAGSADSTRHGGGDVNTSGPSGSADAGGEVASQNSRGSGGASGASSSTDLTTSGPLITSGPITTSSSNTQGASGGRLQLQAVRERSGLVDLVLSAGPYHLDLRAEVPERYPDEGVALEVRGSNLPADLQGSLMTAARDLVRRLAEPPHATTSLGLGRAGAGTGGGGGGAGNGSSQPRRRGPGMTLHSEAKAATLAAAAQEAASERQAARVAAAAAHEPRPSLLAAVQMLLEKGVAALGAGRCGVCSKRLLPSDPDRLGDVPPGMQLLRLAGCGHFMHARCIEAFLSEPPFGRFGCPVPGCGERISHHRLVTDPQVLEARWAGKQARCREIEDAASILGL